MPKLYIAIPCYDARPHVACVMGLFDTREVLGAHGVDHVIKFEPNDSLINRARNVLVAKFLATDCDRLLFIDSDVGFRGEDVLRLLVALESPDIDVACGVYPRKSPEVSFPVNFAIDDNQCLTFHDDTGCVELRSAPTGFLMLKRDVLERMIGAYPERKCQFQDAPIGREYALFDCLIEPETGHYQSEDFGFSYLWRKIGGRLWADPEISLAHYGQWKFTGSIKPILRPVKPARPQDIQGWMSDEELAFLSGAAAGAESVIEIGCWKGRSTFALLSACRGPVYAVDHWLGSEGEREGAHREAVDGDVFGEFVFNVGQFQNLRVMRSSSLEAAALAPDADLVFIDGGHRYEDVAADITAWRGKARKILCGHDYQWPGVRQAVQEAFGEVQTVGTIWIHHVG